MIPTQLDHRNPGGLFAVLYTEAGRALEVADLGTDRIAEKAAGRHAVACSEGAGKVGIYDGDSGELVLVLP